MIPDRVLDVTSGRRVGAKPTANSPNLVDQGLQAIRPEGSREWISSEKQGVLLRGDKEKVRYHVLPPTPFPRLPLIFAKPSIKLKVKDGTA